MTTKTIKLGLLPKVLIAIALGILFSFFMPQWFSRIAVTFSSLFSNLLGMFIPLLIIGLIVPGISDIGRGAGKLLFFTIAIAYFSTIFASFFSYFSCQEVCPHIIDSSVDLAAEFSKEEGIAPYFVIDMPPIMSVTTALALSIMLGISLIHIKGTGLRNVVYDFKDFVFIIIQKLIIPLLPIHIFCIFLQMGVEGKVFSVIELFVRIIAFIFILHILLLLIQFCIAGIITRRNPIKALITMLPAYLTALGTQSSAATIPVTLKQAKKNGVNDEVAEFVIPLCATVHIAGSALKIVACAYAISFTMSMPIGLDVYGGFIMMLAIIMIAAPGVPGGAIMSAIGLIESALCFDTNLQGLMIALYIAMDSFGTAANVTGDGAIAMIINKIHSKKSKVQIQ